MAQFPSMSNPARLTQFLSSIPSMGIPSGTVTTKWLPSVGFKSSNDRPIIGILKMLGFIDESSKVTHTWRQYRDKEKAPGILAAAVKQRYPALFETYPDAHRKDDEALRNFFRARSEAKESTVTFMVRTFKALREMADFEASVALRETEDAEEKEIEPDVTRVRHISSVTGPTINVNIQITLPASNDESVYENLFRALYKHILSKGEK